MMNLTLPLRGVELLFAFLVLCLSAAGISKLSYDFDGYVYDYSFASLNFLLFCSIFAILSLIYLLVTPHYLAAFHHVYAVLALEFLNMIFFFAGFIAVAADVGVVDCDLTFGQFKTACQCIKAATAFGAFSWLAWLISLVLVARQVWLERSGGVPADTAVAPGDVGKDVQMESNVAV